jgi:hypothetical protein
MKILLTTAAFALASVPAFAQEPATGTSNPPPAVITASPDEVAVPRTKPSAAVAYAPGSPAATSQTPSNSAAYGTYVPYNPTGTPVRTAPRDPDAEIVTSVPVHREAQDDSGIVMSVPPRHEANEDAGIVTYVPSRPNEVPAGTLLATRIKETISTVSTPVGTRFTAEVTAPMERDGRVIIPAGSVLHGRVTVVRGGRRISGAAAIHLLPENVTLPDGTQYVLHAQVIDTSEHNVTRIDDEGTILRRDHVKGTLAAMSLTTGGAAATGAVLGGVPGAFIGAGIGAGVSTVWWLKQDRQAVVPQDTAIIFSLSTPMSVTPLTLGTN